MTNARRLLARLEPRSLPLDASRIHAGTSGRSQRDPAATESVDVAGAIAFAVRRADGADPSPAARQRRQLAVNVYLFRNWPSFADQHRGAMQTWARRALARICECAEAAGAEWQHRAKVNRSYAEILVRVADAAVTEFSQPEHCETCGGHGQELCRTVLRACSKCGGLGTVQWSANARSTLCRVRRASWPDTWEPPYLALLDRLVELERHGAALHAQALG